MESSGAAIELDDLDRKIISALRAAPKSTNAALARKLRVAKTTIGLRLGRLTDAEVLRIVGATNPARVGYSLSAWALIQCRGRKVEDIGADLAAIPEAVAVGSLIGNYQLFVNLMARGPQHLASLLAKIGNVRGVTRTSTSLALNTLKYSTDHKTIRLSDEGTAARLHELNLTDLKHTHDELDRSLLAEYQNDGRVTYRELARRYDVPESTIRARSRRLEKKGEIVYLAATDPVLMGIRSVVLVLLQTSASRVQQIADELCQKSYAYGVLTTAGVADILCITAFETSEEMHTAVHEWIPSLEGVQRVEILQQIEILKQLLGWARQADASVVEPHRKTKRIGTKKAKV
jgi:Lrp/AsnC family transcriptional regulator for asnA, asnC and gidA